HNYRPRGLTRDADDRIRAAVEVVRGVDGALGPLPGPVENLLGGVESSEVMSQLVFVVDVRRKAKPVAKPAIDDVPGAPIGGFQIVAVQVVSQCAHAPDRPRDIGGWGRILDDAPVRGKGRQLIAQVLRRSSSPPFRQDRSPLVPRVTRSSSSCSNVSCVPLSIPARASSRASFVGWSSCMTSSVRPPFSSKVTVVTAPPSSFVQTRRACGFTSRYLPKPDPDRRCDAMRRPRMLPGQPPAQNATIAPQRNFLAAEARDLA